MFRMSYKKGNNEVENPYWMSFSDIMSGLLLVFMLATTILILELTDKREKVNEAILEIKKAEEVKDEVLHEIKTELERLGIAVIINDNESLLRIPQGTLSFKKNSDDIPNENFDDVTAIGQTLFTSLMKENRISYFNTIFIEGHTDSDRSNLPKGNWGLSTSRAISVWEFWETESTPFNFLTNMSGESIFSVSGYGSTRRVNEREETEDDKRANRRIDIRFTVKKPSLTDLQSVEEMF